MATTECDGFVPVADMDIRVNGGYFVLRHEIFDTSNEGEDLVMNACVAAAARDGCRPTRTTGSGPLWIH